jgi:hypothetical protein
LDSVHARKMGKETWSSLLCFFRQDRVCEEEHRYLLEVLVEVEIRSDTNSYAFQVACSGEEEGEEKEKFLVVSNIVFGEPNSNED